MCSTKIKILTTLFLTYDSGLRLIVSFIAGFSRSRPSAFVQLDLASSLQLKKMPKSQRANLAGSLGGVELSALNSASATLDGTSTIECLSLAVLLPQHTCSPVRCKVHNPPQYIYVHVYMYMHVYTCIRTCNCALYMYFFSWCICMCFHLTQSGP